MNKFWLLLSLCFIVLNADPVLINSHISILDNYKYETPQGNDMKVPQDTKRIIIAFEKDTGAIVNNFLNTKDKYYLEKSSAVFILDIHRMPSIISKIFALPKLKKYEHPIYLHYGEKLENFILRKENMLTVLDVHERKIIKVNYISNKKELEVAIER